MKKTCHHPPKPSSCGNQLLISALLLLFVLLLISSASANPTARSTAAERGDAHAQYELAISLLKADSKQPNYADVIKWLRRAADQGHAGAQYSLALRYLFGQGVQKNDRTAVDLLQKAADQGFADAQFSLGLRYFWGQGVRKDLAQAGLWFRKAARQGHPKAGQFLAKLPTVPPAESPADAALNDSEQLIEGHVLAAQALAKGAGDAVRTKQQLEKKMTAAEVMQAIQRSAKQNPNRLSDQELAGKLVNLSSQLKTAEDYFLEGNRLVKSGELQQAVAAYEKSLRLAPENASSRRNLASAYAHLGENRKAIENLQKSIDLSPGRAAKHAMLGLIFHSASNLPAALREYRTAARLNPGIGWIYPDMAAIYIRQKNYPIAWKAHRQAELLGHAKERIHRRLADLAPGAESSPQAAPGNGMHMRQLVLPTRQLAEGALIELQKGAEFSQLAKKLSVKQYRLNGGYWGPYRPESLATQFRAALKELSPLAYSSIIETAAGFHILQKFPVFTELTTDGEAH